MKKINIGMQNNLSNALYIAKAFAVVSIVLAHTSYESISSDYIKAFLSIYKLIGVYIFFIISGYFYNKDKYKNIWELLKDKAVKIGIPWITFGTIIYGITLFLNNDMKISCIGYINHILGNGTYLYFLTMLMLSYVLMYFIPKKQEYILIAVNIVSILLTSLGVLPQVVNTTKLAFCYFNPYLNVMNWIGVFAIGVLIRRKNFLEIIKTFLKDKVILISISYAILFAILCLFKLNISYWNLLSLIIGVLSFVAVLSISLRLSNINWLVDIGKKSFFIYQIHALFVSIFRNILANSNVFAILRALVIVLTIYFIAILGQRIARFIKLEKIYNMLLGIR